MLNFKLMASRLGTLMFLEAAAMMVAVIVSICYNEPDFPALFSSALITTLFGVICFLYSRNKSDVIGSREGYILSASVWVIFSIFGAMPYYFSGCAQTFTDAFFEAISGFTATGATIITHIDGLPHGILMWRSMTQFIGGLGILFLLIIILPTYGVGNMMLYQAETGVRMGGRIQPRIKDMITRLAWVYFGLFVILIVILLVMKMSFFDALCHSMTTISTGGFSTHDNGVRGFSSSIQCVIMIFMFLSGTNYSLLYYATGGKIGKLFRDGEFRCYLGIIIVASIVVILDLAGRYGYSTDNAVRSGLFHVISILSSTGFEADNYSNWTSLSVWVTIVLMIIGGCSGSTSGGMKVIRVLLFWKMIRVELKKIVHNRGIFPVKFNQSIVREDMLHRLLAYLLIYLALTFGAVTILSFSGMDVLSAINTSITSLSNMGPVFAGTIQNFAEMAPYCKWTCAALMLIGRLEIFSIMVLTTRVFWKQN